MQITINQEDQKELKLLQEDLIRFLTQLKMGLISFTIYLFKIAKEYFMSYTEYSIDNIKQKGISNILYKRALRFFGMETTEEQQRKDTVKPTKGARSNRTLKSILKIILYPVYFLIILLLKIFKRKSEKKYINKYKT